MTDATLTSIIERIQAIDPDTITGLVLEVATPDDATAELAAFYDSLTFSKGKGTDFRDHISE